MATPERLAEMESEWRAEGRSDEEIGARIRELANESEAKADEPEAEPSTPFPQTERAKEPPEGWQPCTVCVGMGIIPAQLQPSKIDTQCPDCSGSGEVLTGSLKPDYATLQCSTCVGNGYVAKSVLRSREESTEPPPARSW